LNKKYRIEALKIRNFEYTGYVCGRNYFSLWDFTPKTSQITKIYQKLVLKKYFLSSLILIFEFLRLLFTLFNPNIVQLTT